eukprot:gene6970-7711_t
MIGVLLSIICLLCIQYACTYQWPSIKASGSLQRFRSPVALMASKPGDSFQRWTNSRYSEEDLEKMWRDHDFLLTIGSNGVSPSHGSSLKDLISHHSVVKVKLASDRLNPLDISKQLLAVSNLQDVVEILEIRRRGFSLAKKAEAGV